MKQQKEKMKKWAVLGVGVVILGIGLWRSQLSPLLGAEAGKSSSQKEETKTKEKTTKVSKKTSLSTQTLSAVSNDQGLSATPKIVQLAQSETFPEAGTSTDELKRLVTDVTIPKSASGLSWEYVNKEGAPVATPSSETIGTQLVYLKITENATSSSIQVPIPVTVTDETVSIEDGIAYTSRKLDIITTSDVVGAGAEERAETLKQKLGVRAWDITTGEELSVTISDLDGLNEAAKIGVYQLTYSMTMADKSERKILRTYTFLTDEIMAVESEEVSPSTRFDLAQEQAGWTEVPLNSTEGLIVNPVNKSKMGFINRGLVPQYPTIGGNQGILIVDETERNFLASYGKMAAVPYVNGSLLHPPSVTSGVEVTRGSAVEYRSHTKEYYMMRVADDGRKELKEILIDTPNQVAYVYNYTLSRNLNFSAKLSMYNTADEAREFAVLEMLSIAYYEAKTPLYPLPNNAGFRVSQVYNKVDKRMSFKYKDAKGDFLSEFTMYNVGGRSTIDNYPNRPNNLQNANSFLSDFSKSGMELGDFGADLSKPLIEKVDSASQFGTRPRIVQPNEAMNLALEVFSGTELPFMELETDPENFDIYQDDPTQNFETKYTLEKVPPTTSEKPTEGNINIVYPNLEEKNESFIARPTTLTDPEYKPFLAADGNITIPRSKFPDPEHLNDNQGTVKTYHTTIIGNYKAPEADYSGLPSNEVDVKVNVYHLGGTPIAQTVKQGSAWTKTATSLIKDPVILPEHIKFLKIDYVEGTPMPNTNELGLQFVKVEVKDTKAGKTTVVEVPVNVTNDPIPTTGITVAGQHFSINEGELKGLTTEDLKALVLKESKAVGWDNATGLSDGVELSITDAGLDGLKAVAGTYNVTILGAKGADKGQGKVTVTVKPDMSAVAVPQTMTLGTDVSKWTADQLKGIVKEVLGTANYTVTVMTPPETTRITDSGSMKVKVTSVENSAAIIELDVPVKVTWGNSIVLGGSGTNVSTGTSTRALTLHEDAQGKPYLSSTYGNLSPGSETIELDVSSPMTPVYQVTHLDMATKGVGKDQATEVSNGPNASAEVTLEGLGGQNPSQLVSQLGATGKLSLNYGDIVKVYAKQGAHALYTNSQGPTQPVKDLTNTTTMFLRVTENGFVPLYLNQLTAKEVSIDARETTSNAQYDAHYANIAGYFDLPAGAPASNFAQLVPNGFKTYPKLDLAVTEKNKGTVYVAEQTSATSNQYLNLAYSVDFVGTGIEWQIVSPAKPLSFGTQTIQSYTQEVKRADPDWNFTVIDSRLTKNPWEIQAKMTQPFKTTGSTPKELRGAEIKLKLGNETVTLNSTYRTIYKKATPTVTNKVSWKADEGFSLKVPPGAIDKDTSYTTTVEIVLTDAPTGAGG